MGVGVYLIIGMLIVATLGDYMSYIERKQWQAERKDLLDRLMARDLPEVKQAQAIEHRAEGPKSTSKRQNDARLIQMAENAERE